MVNPKDVTTIVCKFAKMMTITLPWAAAQIGKASNLTIEDNDMMFEAVITNHNLDSKQKLYTLFRSQHPDIDHEVDNECFEYPSAVSADVGQPDMKQGAPSLTHPLEGQENEGDEEGGTMGDAPEAIQAPAI